MPGVMAKTPRIKYPAYLSQKSTLDCDDRDTGRNHYADRLLYLNPHDAPQTVAHRGNDASQPQAKTEINIFYVQK